MMNRKIKADRFHTNTYYRPAMEVINIKVSDVICVSFDDFNGGSVKNMNRWSLDI